MWSLWSSCVAGGQWSSLEVKHLIWINLLPNVKQTVLKETKRNLELDMMRASLFLRYIATYMLFYKLLFVGFGLLTLTKLQQSSLFINPSLGLGILRWWVINNSISFNFNLRTFQFSTRYWFIWCFASYSTNSSISSINGYIVYS